MITKLYPMYGSAVTGKMMGRSRNSIQVKATRLGLHRPRHVYNENYFDIIDSSDKAYWIGFISADGYVVNNKDTGTYELGIELSSEDENHLIKLANCIETDVKPTRRVRKNFVNYGYDTECEVSSLRIYSIKIVQSLAKYGIIQNKTYNMQIKNIPDEYIWDYIRGYFDGDGTFCISKIRSSNGTLHQYGRVGFVCKDEKFAHWLNDKFNSFGIISHINIDREWFVISIRKTDSVLLFLHNIYTNADCIKLDRKYNKYIDFYNKLPAQVAISA